MVLEIINEWKQTTNTYQKIQWLYAFAAVVTIIVGGLLSLLDPAFGTDVATFGLYALIIFASNFIAHAIITSLFGQDTAKKPRRK
jgi:uncharacterized PurR-regulated membrane protein YhhQ (DUF165 family)